MKRYKKLKTALLIFAACVTLGGAAEARREEPAAVPAELKGTSPRLFNDAGQQFVEHFLSAKFLEIRNGP